MVYVHILVQQNQGAPWKFFFNLYVNADVHSAASGRSFAGVVDIPNKPTKITAGELQDSMLQQDSQVKEGEVLRSTLAMILREIKCI